MLRITEATARYGASQMANGLGPAEARAVAVEVAAELAMAAEALRRLARLGPGQRRMLAAAWSAAGVPRREIAVRLGVSERAVWSYLRPGSGHRGSPARSGGDCGPDDT